MEMDNYTYENFAEPSCSFSNPFKVSFIEDCHWMAEHTKNDSFNVPTPAFDSFFLIRMILTAFNSIGIVSSLIIYMSLVKSGTSVTFHTFLIMLSVFDFMHLTCEFFHSFNLYTRSKDTYNFRQNYLQDKQILISKLSLTTYLNYTSMYVYSMAVTFTRVLLHVAYPCRNYWVLFIITLRCYVLRYRNSQSQRLASNQNASSCRSVFWNMRIPLILGVILFTFWMVVIVIWTGYSNNDPMLFCGRSQKVLKITTPNDDIFLKLTSLVCADSNADNMQGNNCLDNNRIIRLLHSIFVCGVPFVGVAIGSFLSLSVIDRSVFSDRYRRARIMIYVAGITFIILEMPNFILHILGPLLYDGVSKQNIPVHWHEIGVTITCLNSSIILVLYLLMHNIMRKRIHDFFTRCCSSSVQNSPMSANTRTERRLTQSTGGSFINIDRTSQGETEFAIPITPKLSINRKSVLLSVTYKPNNKLDTSFSICNDCDDDSDNTKKIMASFALPLLETSF